MKKKLALFLLLVFGFASVASATRVNATFGDRNSSNKYRIQGDTDGVVKFASDTGVVYPYQTVTTLNLARLLVTADSGAVITDFGGNTPSATVAAQGYGSKFFLPPGGDATTLGTKYKISVGFKGSVTLDTYDTSDIILYSITGTVLDAGDSIKSTGQAGDSVTVECTAANTWSIVDMHGIWSDNSTN
jgi:hypothetical protein